MISDSKMVSILRGYEHWVGKDPWKDMADRFEELAKKEKSDESSNRTVSEEPS
jgi:CRISPR/Cas system CMR-associated protein Cmr1 (group 7 of RAMP superfamily)